MMSVKSVGLVGLLVGNRPIRIYCTFTEAGITLALCNNNNNNNG